MNILKPYSAYDKIVTGDKVGNLKIWTTEDTSSFKLIDERFNAHRQQITSIASNSLGVLATGGDEVVHLWKPRL